MTKNTEILGELCSATLKRRNKEFTKKMNRELRAFIAELPTPGLGFAVTPLLQYTSIACKKIKSIYDYTIADMDSVFTKTDRKDGLWFWGYLGPILIDSYELKMEQTLPSILELGSLGAGSAGFEVVKGSFEAAQYRDVRSLQDLIKEHKYKAQFKQLTTAEDRLANGIPDSQFLF